MSSGNLPLGGGGGVIAQQRVTYEAPSMSDIVFQCNFNGLNNATTALDEAFNAPITFAGSAKLSTAAPKFGSAALYTDKTTSGTRVTVPFHSRYEELGLGDFTYEMLIRPDTILDFSNNVLFHSPSLLMYLFSSAVSGGPSFATVNFIWNNSDGTNKFPFSGQNVNSGQVGQSYLPNVVGSDQYYHIAVCRFDGMLRFFVQGELAPVNPSSNPNGGTGGLCKQKFPLIGKTGTSIGLGIGGHFSNNAYFGFGGMIDCVRISKTAWYRSDSFTPPSVPFAPYVAPSHVIDTEAYYDPGFDPHTIRPNHVLSDDSIGKAEVNGPFIVTNFSGGINVGGTGFATPLNPTSTSGFTSFDILYGANNGWTNPPAVLTPNDLLFFSLWMTEPNQTISVDSRYNMITTVGDADGSYAMAYRIIDGTNDTYPVFSWTTPTQFWMTHWTWIRGANPTNPIGDWKVTSGNSATQTGTGLTTTSTMSFNLLHTHARTTWPIVSGQFVYPTISGWTRYQGFSHSFSQSAVSGHWQKKPPSGSSTDPVSFPLLTGCKWRTFEIEIRDVG